MRWVLPQPAASCSSAGLVVWLRSIAPSLGSWLCRKMGIAIALRQRALGVGRLVVDVPALEALWLVAGQAVVLTEQGTTKQSSKASAAPVSRK